MQERILLNQLEGKNPEIDFTEIINGANKLYDQALNSIKSIIPPQEETKLEFNDSNLLKAVNNLRAYVLLHEYNIPKDCELIKTPDDYSWPKGVEWPWQKNGKPEIIPEDLIESVDAVFDFWRSTFQSVQMIDDELEEDVVCFTLFALAAKLRLQVDYCVASDFKTEDENAEDNVYFTPNELGLITSIIFDDHDYTRTKGHNGKPLNVLPEKLEDIKVNAISYPSNLELEHLSKGRKSPNTSAIVSRTEAIIWLSDNHIPYEFTHFRLT